MTKVTNAKSLEILDISLTFVSQISPVRLPNLLVQERFVTWTKAVDKCQISGDSSPFSDKSLQISGDMAFVMPFPKLTNLSFLTNVSKQLTNLPPFWTNLYRISPDPRRFVMTYLLGKSLGGGGEIWLRHVANVPNIRNIWNSANAWNAWNVWNV